MIGVSLVQRLTSVARVANHRLLIAILLVAFIVVLTMSAAIRRGHAVMIGQGDQTAIAIVEVIRTLASPFTRAPTLAWSWH